MKKLLCWLLILALMAGFLLWENWALEVEEISVPLVTLGRGFHGFRLVQLSDLHGRMFGDNNEALLRQVAQAQPDLICITGDFFDEKTDLTQVKPLTEHLAAIAPVYYVTGNHEWQVPERKELLEQMAQAGAEILENEFHILRRGEDTLVIAGVDDPCGPLERKSPEELMEEIHQATGKHVPVVMLCHRNDMLPLWAELGASLVLSGHCHGGVVRLPAIGGIFGTNRELFPAYDAGLYRQKSTYLYVSRGLGYSRVPFRLFNRPHIPVLLLSCPNS